MIRVCIITGGHMATCPRMLKAAGALVEAGYEVRWVYVTTTAVWAAEDRRIAAAAPWRSRAIPLTGVVGTLRRWWLGYRMRWHRAQVDRGHATHWDALLKAHVRFVDAIARTAVVTACDLVLGATEGGMAPAATAASRLKVPYILDLEDLYSESRGSGSPEDAWARRIEDAVIPGALMRFVPSQGIARAYDARFSGRSRVVHNVFPLPKSHRIRSRCAPVMLRLCWFSQTIGSDRGLEDAVDGARLARIPVELNLMGNVTGDYVAKLESRAAGANPPIRIRWHHPVRPAAVIQWCRRFDVGLCLERRNPINRDLTITNKCLMYPLAGLALACTDTVGQRSLVEDLEGAAILYREGEVEVLARGLRGWFLNPSLLIQAQTAAWNAAQRRWHWEHPEEKGRFLDAILETCGRMGK